MSNRGFVKIYRSLFDSPLWQEKPFSKGQAWIDLIGLANHADVKAIKGDSMVVYKRGTVNRSILALSERWGWDRRTVRRFLAVLESDRMVSVDGTTQGTTITIENYGKYQNRRTTDGTKNAQREVQIAPTNKNDKNDKNNTPPKPPSRGAGQEEPF